MCTSCHEGLTNRPFLDQVFSLDFTSEFQNWDKDPTLLFGASTVKSEARHAARPCRGPGARVEPSRKIRQATPKAHVVKHLSLEAKGCDHVVLWLDCDREGENICFEVMSVVAGKLNRLPPGVRQFHRARFSAISAPEIQQAMTNLTDPNLDESLAVDARQELDLKVGRQPTGRRTLAAARMVPAFLAQVGVAFTRFQTRFFQGKYGDLDASVISYGPCQTPTLNFCVERHQRITSFQPEPFWVLRPMVLKGGARVDLEWERGRVFDQQAGAGSAGVGS